MNRRLAAVLLVVSAVATPAVAEEAAARSEAPGVHAHDGFLLQVQTGPAYLNLFDSRTSIAGPGVGLHVLAGASPVRNLFVFGDAAVDLARNLRSREVYDDEAIAGGMTFTRFGTGAGYYFGATNFHLEGGVGAAFVSLDDPEAPIDFGGMALWLGAGKEWWVADQLGLGIGASFSTAAVAHREAMAGKEVRAAQSYGLSLTATYQ